MAIIYSYPDNENVLLTDVLLGTSTVRIAGKKKNITKNFTVEALKNLINLNNQTAWGTITGNLWYQTDLWNVLQSKQGNITLTTDGVDGPATFIADVLNIPDYSAGLVVPTLDQVLLSGNVSQRDAKIGELYLYDTKSTAGYAKISADKNRISFWGKTGASAFGFIALDTYVLQDAAANKFEIRKPVGLLGADYTATFQLASGTIAYLSDIPSLTGYALESWVTSNFYPLTGNPSGFITSSALMPYLTSANAALTYYPIPTGTISQYIRGDGSFATFPTIPTIGTWGTLDYPTWVTGTPFVKMTAAGTFALDTNTYLTGITSSDVTTALGYTPVTNARTLTINGVGYDLSADRSWTITTSGGTVTSVAALTLGTTGTDLNSTVANGTTTPVITLNVPDASATARGVITIGTQTIAGAKTLSTSPIISSEIASTIASFDASKNIKSLDTATYPSLTELSYGKGVTSAIQTQLNKRYKQVRCFYASWNCVLNTWKVFGRNTSNMLVTDAGTSVGNTGATPTGEVDANFMLIMDCTKLTKLSLSMRETLSPQTYEILIKTFNVREGSFGRGTETNAQTLIQQTFVTGGGSGWSFLKTDFTIASHTLDARTGMLIYYRCTSATIIPQGINLVFDFE